MKSLKKLFLLIAIASISMIGLASCNADIGFGSYSFHYIHVQMYNTEHPQHFKLDTWKSDDGGIEVKTTNYGTLLLGDGTYMLYDVETCPLCGHVEYK